MTAAKTPTAWITLGRSPRIRPTATGTTALELAIGATRLMVPTASALKYAPMPSATTTPESSAGTTASQPNHLRPMTKNRTSPAAKPAAWLTSDTVHEEVRRPARPAITSPIPQQIEADSAMRAVTIGGLHPGYARDVRCAVSYTHLTL